LPLAFSLKMRSQPADLKASIGQFLSLGTDQVKPFFLDGKLTDEIDRLFRKALRLV
jgi:hypothetical protein